jgi:hypothetical protein
MHLLQTIHLRLQDRLREQQLVLSLRLFQVQNVRSGARREAVRENKAFDLLQRLLSETSGEGEEESGEENGKREASLRWNRVSTNIGITRQTQVLIYSRPHILPSPPKLYFSLFIQDLTLSVCTTIQAMTHRLHYIHDTNRPPKCTISKRLVGLIYTSKYTISQGASSHITLPLSKSVSQKQPHHPRHRHHHQDQSPIHPPHASEE